VLKRKQIHKAGFLTLLLLNSCQENYTKYSFQDIIKAEVADREAQAKFGEILLDLINDKLRFDKVEDFKIKKYIVWKISKADSSNVSYLIGTIAAKDSPDIIQELQKLKIKTDFIFSQYAPDFELSAKKTINLKQAYSGNNNLIDSFNREEWKKLRRIFDNYNLSEEELNKLKASYLVQLLDILPIADSKNSIKSNDFLFNAETYLDFLAANLTNEQYLKVLKKRLKIIDSLAIKFSTDIEHYNNNDLNYFENFIKKESVDNPEYYQLIIQKQNDLIKDKLSETLNKNNSLIILNLLNIIGENGIISKLKSEGFDIKIFS
jgi:uncharacterized protein YbaP (TraB family)